MRRPLTCVGLLLAGAAILTACASPATSGDSTDPAAIEGVWGDSAAANAPYLEFSADGNVVGSDGCNGLNGTYEFDGDTADVKLGVSTLKGCLNVDTWLRDVASVQPEDDVLSVYDHDGESIGTLDREDS